MTKHRRKPLLEAQWRHLAILNYRIDRGILEPFVPAGTELDPWNGEVLVSVVGFPFEDTRVLGIPFPFHRSFEEVNLRFYVRRRVDGEWRRAVTFIKEFVPRRVIAVGARALYNEAYSRVPMGHSLKNSGRSVAYRWGRRDRESSLEVLAGSGPAPIPPGSETEFICEHYWGYAVQRDGGTMEYEVEHPPWLAAPAVEARLSCDVAAVYGTTFVDSLSAEPTSAFLADGSAVKVFRGARIRA